MLFDYTDILEFTAKNQPSTMAKQELDVLNQKILASPRDIEALLQKGFVLFQNHLDGQAIATFEQVLGLDYKCTEAYIWLAELLLFHWSDNANAKLVLGKLLEFSPESAEGNYLLACAYQKEDNLVEYERLLRLTIETDPSLIMPRFCLVSLLLDQNRAELARLELEQLELQVNPNLVAHGSREEYWETMITGRILTEFVRNKLNVYRRQVDLQS